MDHNPDHSVDDSIVCKCCKQTFMSVSLYVSHYHIHKSGKRSKIPCSVPGCSRLLKNIGSLQAHITRFHQRVRHQTCSQSVPIDILCPVPTCQVRIGSRKTYAHHMTRHLDAGESFKCALLQCEKTFHVKKKFQCHMSRYHPKEWFDSTDISDKPAAEEFVDPGFAMETEDLVKDLPHHQETEENPLADYEDDLSEDLYPESTIKDELAKFYLKLEAELVLPSSTVQCIPEEIKLISELSHYCLKRAVKRELKDHNIEENKANFMIKAAFKKDPVFNIHHKHEDVEQLGTEHLRSKYWKNNYPFVEPQEINLGKDKFGKQKKAHYVPIRETLKILLKDTKIKHMVLESFQYKGRSSSILTDYTDGSAFSEHRCQHEDGKCLQLLLFEDAFEFNAFGPSAGLYKPVGFYYSLGNIRPEYRSKVDLIQLVYMVLEKHLNNTEVEELEDRDMLQEALKPLLSELEDLKVNGIDIHGKQVPVCLMFLLGDNLGQHTVGGYVKSFSSEFFCRFCPISKTQFSLKPYEVEPWRSPQNYDEAVVIAKRKWTAKRKKALEVAKKKALKKAATIAARCSAPAKRTLLKTAISKDALKKLRAINYPGVKYRPSPFNSKVLKFHVSCCSMAPCLAHDIFEGTVKCVVARALKYFIEEKEWFDLETLNKRIKDFKCKGSTTRDHPKPLKSLDTLTGNACEIWNLLRLLPFIIGDLIQEPKDPMWQVVLDLKEICELVCAPKISMNQVAYLKILIKSFINSLKNLEHLFHHCLIPKLHFLAHYADLIEILGPLIRLFTLRYESRHVFFKRVVRACKNYINITSTLAKKCMCRFAYDHISGLMDSDVDYDPSRSINLNLKKAFNDKKVPYSLDFEFEETEVLDRIIVKGKSYTKEDYLVLHSEEYSTDIVVGCIELILINSNNEVSFLLEKTKATNSFNGYYIIQKTEERI